MQNYFFKKKTKKNAVKLGSFQIWLVRIDQARWLGSLIVIGILF